MKDNDQELFERNLKRATTLPPDTMILVPGKRGSWRKLESVLDVCRGFAVRTQAGALSPEACAAAIREFVTRSRADVRAMTQTRCPACLSEDIFRGPETAEWLWRCRRCGAGFDDGDVGLDVDGLWYIWHCSELNPHPSCIAVGPFWDRGRGFLPSGRARLALDWNDVEQGYGGWPQERQREYLIHLLRRDT